MAIKRKSLTALLLAVFAFALSFPAGLGARKKADAAVVSVMLAANGTANIDGVKDAKYDETMVLVLSRPNVGKISTWILWDTTHLYIFSEVIKNNVIPTSSELVQMWHSDSVEYYFDRKKDLGVWSPDDFQLRIDNSGDRALMSGMTHKGFGDADIADELSAIECAGVSTEMGYNVECKFPLSNAAVTVAGADGLEIGFDVQLNVVNEPGVRAAYLTWQGAGNASPAGWGTLKLMNEVPEELRVPNLAEVTVEAGQNVALNKVATMSVGYAWDNMPSRITDGSMATYAQGCENVPWEAEIDLAYEIAINEIIVYGGAVDYVTAFTVYYFHSLFKEWTEIAHVTGIPENATVDIAFHSSVTPQKASSPGVLIELGEDMKSEEIITRKIKFSPDEDALVGGGTGGIWDYFGYRLRGIEAYTSRKQIITLEGSIDQTAIFATDGKDKDRTEDWSMSDSGYKVYRGHKPQKNKRSFNKAALILIPVLGGLTLVGGAAFFTFTLIKKKRGIKT